MIHLLLTKQNTIGDKITYCENEYDTLVYANALLVVVECSEFFFPNFDRIKGLLIDPIIFHGRNIFDSKDMNELGFEYYGMGTK